MKIIDHAESHAINEIIALLEQTPEGIDPDFDIHYEELERQFAERRLTFSNH